ncbi:hypothetical protein FGE12_27710 [Aggregicoccus sp. 17bor-14]|uniref:hypothetical protein n=1 Tax=Myxococcaceae TaxID=31 RepID=UPI00129CD010|nr:MULTISPECIES: hypothetical protein [Myxococcaceae]MBF5046233.1 hypothetical protein [Simulacricoccus sp. 17bor-14]MRI91957.1 hypothetical protein [Aggregicoccus sp. 17bor-14]
MRIALLLSTLLLLLLPGRAEAYPWMIRHGYASCATCHVDPSGGGLVTKYGRAQSELLLATQWRKRPEGEQAGEVSRSTGFLFGFAPLPEWLDLGISLRGARLSTRAGEARDSRWLQMVTDLRGGLNAGPVRAGASIGYLHQRGLPTAITSRDKDNLVSREHWLGLQFLDDTVLVRAGRMNLPYGLRNVEHTSWVRDATRTDINEDQQHGLAVAYMGERVRAELMGIAGNFQLHPSDYREHGYSGYAELALAEHAAVGLSSLVTHAAWDVATLQPSSTRQAHGLFGRWALFKPLVLLAEADLLLQHPQGGPTSSGYTGLLQADYELIQGVHAMVAGEALRQTDTTSIGAWLTLDWFIGPHAELRLDANPRRFGAPPGGQSQDVLTLLAQLHLTI